MKIITYNMPKIKIEGLMWSALRLRERGCLWPVLIRMFVRCISVWYLASISRIISVLKNFHILDFYMNFYTFNTRRSISWKKNHILENSHFLENILIISYFLTLSKLQYTILIGRRKKYSQVYNLYDYLLN